MGATRPKSDPASLSRDEEQAAAAARTPPRRAPDARQRAVTKLTTRVLCSGVLVLSGTVVLAVGGAPWLAAFAPFVPSAAKGLDPAAWVAGCVLIGGLCLLLIQGWMLKPLQRWGAFDKTAAPASDPVQTPQAEPASRTAWASALAASPPDPLTGLLTATSFELHVQAWQRARAGAAVRPASLLLIDLDRFKRINDTAGRAAGDALLREAAQVLLAHVREGDAVARLEDDTFAMLLPGCQAEQAVHLGRRLRSALGELGVDHHGRRLGVGATVGVAARDARESGTAADWLLRARAAWYEAKYGGAGGVRLAAPATSVSLVAPA